MSQASRDQNFVTTLLAVSSVDGVTPVVLWADPTSHRLLVDNANTGAVTAITVASANGFAGSVTATTTPVITLSTTITGLLIGNGTAISAVTIGTGLSLVGSTLSSTIAIGTTAITSGTTTRILYDNAGVVGEYTLTGSGTVVAMQTSPSLVTPVLGVAMATSLAIGGATIGTNGLAVTGHLLFEGVTSTGATGTGALVFGTSPTLTTPNLGTPTALVLTSATGLPAAQVLSGALANGMTATTQTAGDNSTKVATTAYADGVATTGSTTTTFTFDGSGGTSSSVTLQMQKIGKFVTIYIPVVTATTGTGSVGLTSNTAIPAGFRPTSNPNVPVTIIMNNGANVDNALGILVITSTGFLTFYRAASAPAFTNAAAAGSNAAMTATYYIV